MILNNQIFKNYLEHVIGCDILEVLKKKKIPLRDVARDPVLVSVLKRYSGHKDGVLFLCCCSLVGRRAFPGGGEASGVDDCYDGRESKRIEEGTQRERDKKTVEIKPKKE
jgi:hypothetical protein